MNKKITACVLIAVTIFLTACGHGGADVGGQTDVHTPASSAPDTPREETENDLTDSTSLPEDTKEAEAMVITKAIKFNKGTVKNSVQGMSVWHGKLFQLYHTGDCNVFDLEAGIAEPIATFRLGSASDGNHANNCNFGTIHYNGNPIPLLYVVDGNSGNVMKCSVENIVEKDGTYTSECIQTIHLDQSGFAAAGYMPYWGWPSWLVGTDGEHIWLHGARYRTNRSMDAYYDDNRYIITKFRLPSPDKKLAVLTADDVVEQFTTEYNVNFTQGGTVSGKYLFYTFGTGKADNPSAIRAWDLEKQKLLSPIDVSEVTEELEDCTVIGDRLYFITQKSNLYYIPLSAAVGE